MLAKTVNESQRDWDECLPLVLAAYRATPHESTGLTPNRLFLGHEVRMPIDLVMGLPLNEVTEGQTADDYVAQLQRNSDDAFQIARKHLRANAERRKRHYDIQVKAERFAVGDWVGILSLSETISIQITKVAKVVYWAILGCACH